MARPAKACVMCLRMSSEIREQASIGAASVAAPSSLSRHRAIRHAKHQVLLARRNDEVAVVEVSEGRRQDDRATLVVDGADVDAAIKLLVQRLRLKRNVLRGVRRRTRQHVAHANMRRLSVP